MSGAAVERYVADLVLTCDEQLTLHRPGAVDVKRGRIVRVGSPAEAPHPAGPVHSLSGLLMPGLVNIHCHSPMALFRGLGEDLPLAQWLQTQWLREARMTPDDAYWGMTLAAGELLTRGVTTTCEMYVFEDAVAAAVAAAGLRCVLTPGVIEAPGWERLGHWPERLQRIADLQSTIRSELVEIGFGPHSAYTLPSEALAEIGRVARETDALVHIHVAETQADDALVARPPGTSVPAYLADLGLFDGRVLSAHSVWLSDDDLLLYRDLGVGVAHCPQSNAKLGSGVARLSDMLALGIRVGLGTDGPASNNNLDLWEDMRLAASLSRATRLDPAAVSSAQALILATRGAAEAIGRSDIGVLAPGRWADMVLLRMDDPSVVPLVGERDLVSHLVWSAASSLVTDVWVGGVRVVSGGVCTTVDMSAALRQVQTRAERLAAESGV